LLVSLLCNGVDDRVDDVGKRLIASATLVSVSPCCD
jgi:hypothetical protein